MSVRPQTTIFDRIFFLGYHVIVLAVTMFALNYYSLPVPSFQSAILRMASLTPAQSDSSQQSQKTFSVSGLVGEVKIFQDEFSGSDKEAVDGDEVKVGYSIETNDQSSIDLNITKGFKATVRILPGSRILFEKDSPNHVLLTLQRGQIMTRIENVSNSALDIRTTLARFSSQTTSISGISTDGKTFSFLAVKSGNVRAENSKTHKFEMIQAKQSYLVVDEKGKERVSLMPEALALFTWDPKSATKQSHDIATILAATGGPFTETVEEKLSEAGISPEEQAKLEGFVTEELRNFQIYTAKLHEEIASKRVTLGDLQKRMDKENLKIEADITCLESQKRCDLYTEKLLLDRGFPRIHNSSRMADAITKDLRKYQSEEAAKLDEKHKEIEDMVKLEDARKETWTWVQSRLSDKTIYREILSKLQDQNLIL